MVPAAPLLWLAATQIPSAAAVHRGTVAVAFARVAGARADVDADANTYEPRARAASIAAPVAAAHVRILRMIMRLLHGPQAGGFMAT